MLPRLVYQTLKIALTFARMGALVRGFNRRFDQAYGELSALDLAALDLPACKKLYYQVYDEFVARWQVPIANDFAVMVAAGAADKLYRAWLDKDGYVQLFSRSRRPLVTLDPGYRIIEIVSLIKKEPKLLAAFAGGQPGEILAQLRGRFAASAAAAEIRAYMERFGSRVPNELKLESKSINEQPEFFISILQASLSSGKEAAPEAPQAADAAASLPFWRRLVLAVVGNWAVNSVFRREETRFRRSLIFGFSRKLFLAIADKFTARGFINNREDIFYLSMEEIFEIIDSGRAAADLNKAIAARKADYEYWKGRETPRRIESELPLAAIEAGLRAGAAPAAGTGVLKGFTAARTPRSKVSGEALVLPDFDPSADFAGKILVTRQTDPGWTIVFPLLKGIIVERGGMLSHAAIVARELRIPCIVGVERAVAGVPRGANIEMHMETGEVHVLN